MCSISARASGFVWRWCLRTKNKHMFVQLYGIDITQKAVKTSQINGLVSPWPNKPAFCLMWHCRIQNQRPTGHSSFWFNCEQSAYFCSNPSSNQQNIQQHDPHVLMLRQGLCLVILLAQNMSMSLVWARTFTCIFPCLILALNSYSKSRNSNSCFLGRPFHCKSTKYSRWKKFTRQILKFSRYSSGKLNMKNNLSIYSEPKA